MKITEQQAKITEMVAELSGLAPEAKQHESLLRARWGRDFDPEAFADACDIVEAEREDWLSVTRALNKIADYLIANQYTTREEIEAIASPGGEPEGWLKDAQNLVGTRDLSRAMMELDICFCELCIRSSIVSLATTEREIECENSSAKADFPVCGPCAEMIDNDE